MDVMNISHHHLQLMLQPSVYNKYCDDVTRSVLNATSNVIWCACGTIYEKHCARNGVPCMHQCIGCKNYVCIGCGKYFPISKNKKSKKKQIKKRNRHCSQKTCDDTIPKGTMKCPICLATVQRTRGCSDMRCTMCSHRFKWIKKTK